ncbi:uncharacterized protein LOC131885416 isoform X2 [Tigriopus californicus]|uniref:uncharacterized protein LOC131885416 isoform X2 n=1 Tax=Tigriopus californicus TaxID=6832 RepID=UPI0027DA0619|nr:uncharacterized protein LOC131885416 isoform X2 [Tigriopus californicus]
MIMSSRAFWVGFHFLILDLLWPSWSSSVESSLVNDKQWMSSLSNKEGTFTADFEEENGTTIAVRDGTKAVLNCRVYLRHDKTEVVPLASQKSPSSSPPMGLWSETTESRK